MKLEDGDRLTLGGSWHEAADWALVLYLNQVIPAEQVRAAVKQSVREVTVGTLTLYERDALAFHLPNPRTMVVAPSAALRHILLRNDQAKLASGLSEGFRSADLFRAVVVTLTPRLGPKGLAGRRSPY